MIHVLAFDEPSISTGEDLRRVAQIVARQTRQQDAFPVVVISALAGVADQFLALARSAREKQSQESARLLEQIRQRHREVAEEALHEAGRCRDILSILDGAMLNLEHDLMQIQMLPDGSAEMAQQMTRVVASISACG